MNVRAILYEQAPAPAPGTAQGKVQGLEGSVFEDVLVQAATSKEHEAERDEAHAETTPAATAAAVDTSTPIGRVVPLVESLASGLRLRIPFASREPDIVVQRQATPLATEVEPAHAELPARGLPPTESLDPNPLPTIVQAGRESAIEAPQPVAQPAAEAELALRELPRREISQVESPSLGARGAFAETGTVSRADDVPQPRNVGVESPTVAQEPARPELPSAVQAPVRSELPEAVQVPARSESPTVAQEPARPELPSAVQAPVRSELPEAVQVPARPELPAAAQAPVRLEFSASSQEPARPEFPAAPSTPTGAELPVAAPTPNGVELPRLVIADDARRELPVAVPAPTVSTERLVADANVLAPRATTTGEQSTSSSGAGAEDSRQHESRPFRGAETRPSTPLVASSDAPAPIPPAAGTEALSAMPAATSTEARAPAASRGDFAAALQASEETRPSTASSAASPAALPIESSFGLAAAGNVSFGAPVAAAGTPAEVLPLHVEWLAARQGGNVRISLHPPELGELQLTVKVRGSAVDIVIQAREPAAQMAVLQSRELLVEALSSRDLHMEQFDVRGLHNDKGNEDSSSQTNTHPQQHGTARRGGEGREGGEGQPTPAELAMNSRNESGVELPVPPPVVEPQTAIDLRI